MHTEIETKLVVLGEDPEFLMEEIASRSDIAMYRLTSKGAMILLDTYYDTPDRSLWGQGVAVRTRERSGSVLFCIKKDEHIVETGAAVRQELELPWSLECLHHAAQIIKETPLNPDKIPSDRDPPAQCLACLGLVPIQSRTTRRRSFDISLTGKEVIIAELALDEVRYSISGLSILHCEIEAEARGKSYEPHIVRLTGLIAQAYPDRLVRWDHNKLITGIAIERLISRNMLPAPLGGTVCLIRSSYDAIDAVLKKPG